MKIKRRDGLQPMYKPDYAAPPGETLKENLEHIKMSRVEIANRAGTTLDYINGIIEGVLPITREIAVELETALNVPATLWLQLEKNYKEAMNN